jgi:glycosyltransferase involved in cell wall biosynthesis
VIICAYRSRRRIDTAIASLRDQDLEERFQVIAVVSGEDGTAEHLADRHPNVRVIRSTHRLYPGAARNAGVLASRGRFIAFLPDDCVANTSWLRLRIAKHRAGYPLVSGAISNATPYSPVGTAAYYVEYAASMPVRGLLEKQPIPHTVSYSRDVFQRVGHFPEIEHAGEDTLFNARCLAQGLEVGYEPRAYAGHINLTGFRAFMSHQSHHGRGLARCVYDHGLEGPYETRSSMLLAVYPALVRYPVWRWRATVRLVAHAGPRHLARFLAVTPLVLAGYFAGGFGALREIRSSAGLPRHDDPGPIVNAG